MKKKHYLIYETRNKLNGMIYIGQRQTNNINDGYLGSGTYLKAAIKKYGRENFERRILYDFDNFEGMDLMEKRLVNEEFIKRKDTYNLMIGGFGNMSGKVVVKDKDGLIFKVSIDDPKYLNGELVSIQKGRVVVKDKDGNTYNLPKDDPRVLSGELVFIYKGKVVVKDKNGKKFQVSKDDPRYLSGELIPHLTGRKHCKKAKDKMSKARKGKLNSQYGRKWVSNIEKQISIPLKKEEVESFLNDNPSWIIGRKFKVK